MTFKDLKKRTDIVWQDHAVGINLEEGDMEDSIFKSELAKELFKREGTNFEMVQIRLKSKSEHTVNGEHFDLELQIYFRGQIPDTPPGPRQKHENPAAISILMSVEKAKGDAGKGGDALESFLGDLKFEDHQNEVFVTNIALKNVMEGINMEDRWVYEGSYTEPPCNPGVYWNVVRTIYPISLDTLEKVKHKMVKLSAESDTSYSYNPSNHGIDEVTE